LFVGKPKLREDSDNLSSLSSVCEKSQKNKKDFAAEHASAPSQLSLKVIVLKTVCSTDTQKKRGLILQAIGLGAHKYQLHPHMATPCEKKSHLFILVLSSIIKKSTSRFFLIGKRSGARCLIIGERGGTNDPGYHDLKLARSCPKQKNRLSDAG
jgi:hypothetical protein